MSASHVGSDFASVPLPEREPGQSHQEDEETDARNRDQEQRREHARDVELESALEDLIGEPRAAPARAGDEFADHPADQGKPARNAQAPEEIGECAPDPQPQERLHASRPTHSEQYPEPTPPFLPWL